MMRASHLDPSGSILLVDDDLVVIHALSKALQGMGTIRFATKGTDALRLVRESPPHLILLDAEMPGMSGFDVCKALKDDLEFAHIPVIFVTGHTGQDFEESGFQCGAADFIAKPIRPTIVAARVRTHLSLKQTSDQLRALSSTDALTGVANRRAFDDAIDREWRRTLRGGDPLSLLIVDVDHFKKYNDLYGHPAGDSCLVSLAQAMRRSLKRPADLAARYGGEEFALLLPSTDQAGAESVAQHLLRQVESLAMPHAGSECAGHVTVSIGVSSFDGSSAFWRTGNEVTMSVAAGLAMPRDLIAAADGALYDAKRDGRVQAKSRSIDTATRSRLVQLPQA